MSSKKYILPLFLLVSLAACRASDAATRGNYCWEDAAHAHRVPVLLLKAISYVESNWNPHAINANERSADHGHMQINSIWLSHLARYGIQREHLFEPCIATHVGAWVLSQEIARYGYTWEAIGAYNAPASNQAARRAYAWKVSRALQFIARQKHPTRIEP
jgi:soluble lytic murein transglycosylase-like protein